MNLKVFGAVCVVLGCGSFGFLMAGQYHSRIRLLRNMIVALDYMSCELQYRCTPLPQLCMQAGMQNTGKIQKLFLLLAEELEAQICPNAARCMAVALDKLGSIDRSVHEILLELGKNLGNFDLRGQLYGLEQVRTQCYESLKYLQHGKENRVRSYQTLGLCAGAAIAILFV